jgi:hypothetical protein
MKKLAIFLLKKVLGKKEEVKSNPAWKVVKKESGLPGVNFFSVEYY